MKLSDQVILVTGARRGLGAAIARGLRSRGRRVVVHYRRSAKAANNLVAPRRARLRSKVASLSVVTLIAW
jgi:3-oxoacyl-[acyl-carrier protein] reductase